MFTCFKREQTRYDVNIHTGLHVNLKSAEQQPESLKVSLLIYYKWTQSTGISFTVTLQMFPPDALVPLTLIQLSVHESETTNKNSF